MNNEISPKKLKKENYFSFCLRANGRWKRPPSSQDTTSSALNRDKKSESFGFTDGKTAEQKWKLAINMHSPVFTCLYPTYYLIYQFIESSTMWASCSLSSALLFLAKTGARSRTLRWGRQPSTSYIRIGQYTSAYKWTVKNLRKWCRFLCSQLYSTL